MPTPKNSASINLNSSIVKSVQIPNKEEKPMRFQYVWDKDTNFFINWYGSHRFRVKREAVGSEESDKKHRNIPPHREPLSKAVKKSGSHVSFPTHTDGSCADKR